ncbi:MAG: hypothetical protein V1723_00745 [Candidatus Uhrbacteria bacterium]
MDFWQVHGILFLFAITLFPRITMLVVGTVSSFGLLGWLGFILGPHLTVAILATMVYWDTNPVLCIIAWVVAIGGTSGEGAMVKRMIIR